MPFEVGESVLGYESEGLVVPDGECDGHLIRPLDER